MLTGGEASHNFHHAFPQDYRNGPNHLDWDPTKLFIWFFHNFTNQIPHIRQTEEADILKARAQVLHALAKRSSTKLSEPLDGIPSWQRASLHRDVECLTELRMAAGSLSRPLVIVIDDYALDVSAYSKHHPGGLALLRRFAIHGEGWHDATEAFHGGFNNHGTAAKQKMESLRIARIV